MSPEASRAASPDPAPVFAALGDATRLLLIEMLADGRPRSIVQLAGDFPVTRQAVSKHLRVLERAGLVTRDRVGRESRFTFVPERVGEARTYLDDVARQWDEALLRLERFVER